MKRFVTIIAIILTIVGIIAPIVWSVIEKKVSLSVNLLSATPIVGINEEVIRNDLNVTFRGEKISKLVKYEFHLLNSGNQPIDAKAVKKYPAIIIPNNIEVLQSIISRTIPHGIQSKVTKTEMPVNIGIEFDLLNQGDSIYFTLYADGDLETKYKTEGRIVGLKEIEFNDYSGSSTNEKIIGWYERIQEIATPIFGVLLSGFIVLVLTNFSIPRRNQRNLLLKKPDLLTGLKTREELINFIHNYLAFYPGFIKQSLVTQVSISNIDDSDVINMLHYKLGSYLLKLGQYEIPFLVGAFFGAATTSAVAFMKLMA